MNNIKIVLKKKENPRIEFWVSLKPRMRIKIWDGIVQNKVKKWQWKELKFPPQPNVTKKVSNYNHLKYNNETLN